MFIRDELQIREDFMTHVDVNSTLYILPRYCTVQNANIYITKYVWQITNGKRYHTCNLRKLYKGKYVSWEEWSRQSTMYKIAFQRKFSLSVHENIIQTTLTEKNSEYILVHSSSHLSVLWNGSINILFWICMLLWRLSICKDCLEASQHWKLNLL